MKTETQKNPLPIAVGAVDEIIKEQMQPIIDIQAQVIPNPDGPSGIVEANADGSLKPQLPPVDNEAIAFRPYSDGTFAKFTALPDSPGFFGLCMNTAPVGSPDNLRHVATTKYVGVANLMCDGINLLMIYRVKMEQAKQEAAQKPLIIAPSEAK